MILWAVCLAVEVAALVMAVRHARPRCKKGAWLQFARSVAKTAVDSPLVALLALAVLSDVAVKLGQVLVLDTAARPFVGLARLLYHLETALLLAWPAGLAAVAWAVFGGGRQHLQERPCGVSARSRGCPFGVRSLLGW